MGQVPSTAILIFANSPEQELSNKPLINNKDVFDALTKHTLKVVHNTGLPYFHFTERSQKGNSFKERYVNALERIFEMGFSNVISIGNDSPQLRTSDLLRANTKLQEKKTVLGPSADGGIYLMGIHQADFRATEFLELPWKTSNLYSSLLELVSQRKNVVKLNTLFDLDNIEDLKLYISRFQNIPRQLLTTLLGLLSPAQIKGRASSSIYQDVYGSLFFNKGSPMIIRDTSA